MHTKLKTFAAVSALLLTPLCLLLAIYCIKLRAELSPQIALIEQLGTKRDTLASEVFDHHGRKIGEFATERRYFVPLKAMPQMVVKAFLSAEDKSFYNHSGVSPMAIIRAAFINLRGGGFRQGASTITQQLARLSFLSQDRTFERKVKEAILALAIERRLSKDRILELYLNKIYLGNASYGVEAAARNYFRKHATELTIGEAAMIAGLAKSPSRYAPNKNLSAAHRRQKFVLQRMLADRVITRTAASLWGNSSVKVYPTRESFDDQAPYFMQQVASEIERKLGLLNLATDGLKIYTTLHADLQHAAVETVGSLIQAAALKAPKQGPSHDLQAALVSVSPDNGAILAMQGGSSFNLSQFNRASATWRPIGQLIAPIYVALALEQGLKLTSHVDDDPYGTPRRGKSMAPTLFDVLRSGDATLGLPLVATMGLGTLASFAKRLGLGPAAPDFRLALGEIKSSPLQIALTYAAFAARGKIEEPYAIERIVDGRGKLIYQRTRQPDTIVMSSTCADRIRGALDVAMAEGHAKPKAGAVVNTGGMSAASDDLRDGWYVGVDRQIVTSVWLGSERGASRLASSTQAARDLMSQAWAQYASSPACQESRQATRSHAARGKRKGL